MPPLHRRRSANGALLASLALALLSASPAAPSIPAGYYSGVDASSPLALRQSLHAIIDDHTRLPYTAAGTDTWDVLEGADEDPCNPANILDVYKNASYAKQGGGNPSYEREHTWPSSYGFPIDSASNYPFTDCHQLFLCDSLYNSERQNKPFRFCDPSCTIEPTLANCGGGGGAATYPGNSNWTTGFGTFGSWEVWGDRRGDVARALFYMDVRYEGGTHGGTGASEPDLILTNDEALILSSNTGSNESVAYMGMLAVLVEWHLSDPVDAREQARNDAVWAHQGNRNPFIDHPEWVAPIFVDLTQPVADPWINELHYDNDGGDTGEMVEIAGPAGLDLTGYRVLGYNGSGGGVYDTLDLFGTLPNEAGCLGTLSFAFPGLQNGAPDALALVDPIDTVIELISYEGTLNATDGPAWGLASTDIGVSELSSTPIGQSLQLVGSGTQRADFSWQAPSAGSPGSANAGQTFGDACGDATPPAAPTGLLASAGDGQVGLSWNANFEPDLDGYNVYRSTTSGSGYLQQNAAVLSSPAYTDTSVVNGTPYYYVVTAIDTSFNESGPSAEDSATPQAGVAPPGDPWINELHYDNASTDVGEFVEIAGPAGLDLSGWKVVGYNGNGGGVYDTVVLAGVLPDQGGCTGTLAFAFGGMQNGAPDGLALVDDGDQVIEFQSYEGAFTATGGVANGLFSTDIGVAESSATPIGHSLQLGGSGSAAADFSWQTAQAETPGSPNAGQTFQGGCSGAVLPYGCGLNPAGSLTVLSGTPAIGTTITLGVDNPLGTQAPGSIPLLIVDVLPSPAYPCGIPLPGFGMGAPGASGELLVALTPQIPIPIGAPWTGAGIPAPIPLSLPANPNLVGKSLYVQGAIVDPFTALGVGIGLAEAVELQVGP